MHSTLIWMGQNISTGRQSVWDAILVCTNRSVSGETKEMLGWFQSRIHVMRDSWTKVNVLPAKIVQVCLHVHFCVFVCITYH